MDNRFRWDERLHKKSDFKRVFQQGRRFSASGLTMWMCRHSGEEALQRPRLGLAVPKAYGNAVARNRIKRLLRETFRLNKAKISPGVDMVFSARSGAGVPGRQAGGKGEGGAQHSGPIDGKCQPTRRAGKQAEHREAAQI